MIIHKYKDVIREEVEGTGVTALKTTIKRNDQIISKECGNLYIKLLC